MKKRLFWTAATLAVLWLGWLIDPMGAATKTAAYLETAQTFTARKTFSGGIAASGSSDVVDLGYDYSLAQPGAPTAAMAQTTGGTCSNANTYRFYASWKNKTGVSVVSAASADLTPPSLTTNRITVTRPTAAAEATTWNAWYSSSVDGHANKKGCNISGGSTDVAIGTSTSECQCRTSGSTFAPTVATARRIGGWYFNKDYPKRTEVTTLEVCSFGCEYSTIATALAAITDASASKRYMVLLQPPFASTASFSMKSYVSLVGGDRIAVSISNATVPTGTTEIGFYNLTLATGVVLSSVNSTDGWIFFSGINLGSPSAPTAGFVSLSEEKWHVVADDIVGWVGNLSSPTTFSVVSVSDDCSYYENNATWFVYNLGHEEHGVYRMNSHGGHGSRTSVRGSKVVAVQNSSSADSTANNIIFFNNAGGSFASRDTFAEFIGVSIDVFETTASRSATTACVVLGAEDPDTTFNHRVSLVGSTCRITRTSSSGTIAALLIPSSGGAADSYSKWTMDMLGGEIALSGGANRYDMSNSCTTGTPPPVMRITGVRHAGNYNGSGSMAIEDSPLTTGVWRSDALASPPASCRLGDRYVDTSGADCVCTTTGTPGTWTNSSGTGSCA